KAPRDSSAGNLLSASSCAPSRSCASSGIRHSNGQKKWNACLPSSKLNAGPGVNLLARSMRKTPERAPPRTMSDLNIEKLREKILAAQRILVLSHIRPDGDAIGSILGLGLALQAGGKQVQMVSADGVPPTFRHLEGHDQIVNRPQGDFDLICVVDCSDLNRTGEVLKNGTQP